MMTASSIWSTLSMSYYSSWVLARCLLRLAGPLAEETRLQMLEEETWDATRLPPHVLKVVRWHRDMFSLK